MKVNANSLPDRLARQRKTAGFSMRQLAHIIGVGVSTISRIEAGVGMPDFKTNERLEKWLSTGESSGPPNREDYLEKLERRVKILEAAVFGIKP